MAKNSRDIFLGEERAMASESTADFSPVDELPLEVSTIPASIMIVRLLNWIFIWWFSVWILFPFNANLCLSVVLNESLFGHVSVGFSKLYLRCKISK